MSMYPEPVDRWMQISPIARQGEMFLRQLLDFDDCAATLDQMGNFPTTFLLSESLDWHLSGHIRIMGPPDKNSCVVQLTAEGKKFLAGEERRRFEQNNKRLALQPEQTESVGARRVAAMREAQEEFAAEKRRQRESLQAHQQQQADARRELVEQALQRRAISEAEFEVDEVDEVAVDGE